MKVARECAKVALRMRLRRGKVSALYMCNSRNCALYRGKMCPQFSLVLVVNCLYYNVDILHILKLIFLFNICII